MIGVRVPRWETRHFRNKAMQLECSKEEEIWCELKQER